VIIKYAIIQKFFSLNTVRQNDTITMNILLSILMSIH